METLSWGREGKSRDMEIRVYTDFPEWVMYPLISVFYMDDFFVILFIPGNGRRDNSKIK